MKRQATPSVSDIVDEAALSCTFTVGVHGGVSTLAYIWWYLVKLNMNILYDPAISFVKICPEEMHTGYYHKNMYKKCT